MLNRISCLPVQGNFQNEKAFVGIEEEALLINIHGVNNKGKVFVGYDAYSGLLRAMLYTYPLGLTLNLPLVSTLGKKIYAYIAGNRITQRCTTDTCPMPEIQNPFSETQDYLITGWNRLAISKKFWISVILIFILGQAVFSWFSPLLQKNFNLRYTRINAPAKSIHNTLINPLKKYLGLNQHPVFMDEHFKGYNHIARVVYQTDNNQEIEVPIIQKNGMPGSYVTGATWINITFHVVTMKILKEGLEKGITPYLQYFQMEQMHPLPPGNFVFYIKPIAIPKDWEKDFLRKQMALPWVKAGTCVIRDDSFDFSWTKEMEAIFESEQ